MIHPTKPDHLIVKLPISMAQSVKRTEELKNWGCSVDRYGCHGHRQLINRLLHKGVLSPSEAPSSPPEFDPYPDYLSRLDDDQRGFVEALRRCPRAILNTSDLGTGKTRMALVGALSIHPDTPVLVITLKTPKRQWVKETVKIGYKGQAYAPDQFRMPGRGEVLVYHYDQLPPLAKEGNAKKAPLEEAVRHLQSGTVIVLDECQRLSNNKTALTKRARKLIDAVYKKQGWIVGLTATPVMNKEQEYWNMLVSLKLSGQYFGNYEHFKHCFGARQHKFMRFIEFHESERKQDLIQEHLSGLGFSIKRPVQAEITEHVLVVDISAKLTQLLDKLHNDTLSLSDEELLKALNSPLSFQTMGKAKQALNKEKQARLVEVLDMLEDRGPLVVTCTNTEPLEALGKRKGWGVLTGQTSQAQRDRLTEDFVHGKLKGLALGMRAGGTGLSLPNCAQMLLLDLDYNPAQNKQVKGRILRRDSVHSSFDLYRVVGDHPFEERLNGILRRKESLAEVVAGEGAGRDD